MRNNFNKNKYIFCRKNYTQAHMQKRGLIGIVLQGFFSQSTVHVTGQINLTSRAVCKSHNKRLNDQK